MLRNTSLDISILYFHLLVVGILLNSCKQLDIIIYILFFFQ